MMKGALEQMFERGLVVFYRPKRVEPRKKTFRPLLQGMKGFILFLGEIN
jgi:hypothetical protein